MAHDTSYEEYRAELEKQIARSVELVRAHRQDTHPAKPVAAPWRDGVDTYLQSPPLDMADAGALAVRPPKNVPVQWHPDYALPMFSYAKARRVSPASLVADAAKALEPAAEFSKVEATGPYVNLRLADDVLMTNLKNIIATAATYGHITDNAGKVAIVEYSSPNVAKPFGINHLRSTVIGESLARIMAATGYTVVRDNHLGDWGTQFGNLLAAHQEYAPERDFASLSMDELTALYVRFSQEKKESPQLVRLGQTCFARLEAGDLDLREKWTHALELSLEEFSAMYNRLHVRFDTMIGEGYYVEASNKLIEDLAGLVPAELVVFDQKTKAVYINAEHPVVVRTQDGYGVYAARDLATVQFRQQTYDPDVIMIVVGEEQASYFRAVFGVADKAGLSTRPDGTKVQLEQVGFGLLLDKDGKKLSTRKGTSGKLEDVIDTLDAHAMEETVSRNPEMNPAEVREIAQKVAVGALIWNDLRTDRISSVRFDIERMLELGGGSVVDVLYTYSRTCSILEKLKVSNDTPLASVFPANFSTEVEHQLAVRLSELENVVRKAALDRAPHGIVLYLQELSQLHGRFYEESRVAGLDDANLANLRIALHRAYKIVVENGLGLLNIPLSPRL